MKNQSPIPVRHPTQIESKIKSQAQNIHHQGITTDHVEITPPEQMTDDQEIENLEVTLTIETETTLETDHIEENPGTAKDTVILAEIREDL
jgi:uncharacterized membrane protein